MASQVSSGAEKYRSDDCGVIFRSADGKQSSAEQWEVSTVFFS